MYIRNHASIPTTPSTGAPDPTRPPTHRSRLAGSPAFSCPSAHGCRVLFFVLDDGTGGGRRQRQDRRTCESRLSSCVIRCSSQHVPFPPPFALDWDRVFFCRRLRSTYIHKAQLTCKILPCTNRYFRQIESLHQSRTGHHRPLTIAVALS